MTRNHGVRQPGRSRGVGQDNDTDAAEAARQANEARDAELARRLAAGRYRDLLPAAVQQLIREAGQDDTLREEIGALRLVMTRLVARETPDEVLAEHLPRIVNTTLRALKAQRTLAGETAGDLTAALTRVLIEMGLGE